MPEKLHKTLRTKLQNWSSIWEICTCADAAILIFRTRRKWKFVKATAERRDYAHTHTRAYMIHRHLKKTLYVRREESQVINFSDVVGNAIAGVSKSIHRRDIKWSWRRAGSFRTLWHAGNRNLQKPIVLQRHAHRYRKSSRCEWPFREANSNADERIISAELRYVRDTRATRALLANADECELIYAACRWKIHWNRWRC